MRGARELILAAALAATAGCGEDPATSSPPPPVIEAARSTPPVASTKGRRARVGRPARLLIPSIGVSSRLETLGLLPDGRLAPPRDPERPGWWRGGPRPGQRGAAVIAGHVDSRTGPAVFAGLTRLRRGARIVVVDGAGRRVGFAVRSTQELPKDAFPTQAVYGRTRRPTLRLITCTGTFDRSSGHYRSNLVVFAEST